MTHSEYLLKYLTNKVKEPWYTHQCVWMNKSYSKEVQGVTLWGFNWEADGATYKAWGTYDPKYWSRFNAWPWVILQQGDHIIQTFSTTWHIGIVHRADNNWYFLLWQNDGEYDKKTWWNGDGLGNNSIIIRYFKRSERPIMHIFRRKW